MANWVGPHGCGCPGVPPPAEELIAHLHQLRRTLQESAHLIHEASTPGTAQEADADGNMDIELGKHVQAIVQHKQQATTKRTQNGPTNQGSRRRTTQTTTSRRSCQTRGEDVGAPSSQIVPSTSAAQVTSIAIHKALLGLRRRHLPSSHGSSSTSAAIKTARSLPRRRILNIVACLQKARPLAKHQGDPTLLHPLPTPSQLLHRQQDSPQRQPILSVQQDERCFCFT